LRRLESSLKSPLYTLFGESASSGGLATIRALGKQNDFVLLNEEMIDASQRPYYFLQAVRRWLMVNLNLLAMVVNVSLVLIVVLLRNNPSIGILGVSLVTASSLSQQMNQALTAATEIEISIVAVERIRNLANLEPEEKPQSKDLISASNVSGEISFEDVSVAYRDDLPSILKNLNFSVKNEKIGCVGRSGSGKSSLILALFRMLETRSGTIRLDGQDIKEIDVNSLRNSMTVIPQNPLILADTVKNNLDPEGVCTEDRLWEVLEQTKASRIFLHLAFCVDFTDLNCVFDSHSSPISSTPFQRS